MKRIIKIISLYLIMLLAPYMVFAETNVSTLEEFNQAITEDNEIKLLNDLSIGSNTFLRKKTTIDLNGKIINMNSSTLVTYGDTIIKDTSSSKIGKIISSGSFVIQNGGGGFTPKLVLESGTIEGSNYGIRNMSTLTINNGKVTSPLFTIYNDKDLVINGGEVITATGIAVQNKATSTFEMTDGRVVTNGDSQAINFYGNCTGQIKGGTVEATYYNPENGKAGNGITCFKDTSLTISGGTIKSPGNAILGNGSESGNSEGTNAKFIITGGNIKSEHGTAIYAPQINGETTISGGTLEGKTGIEIRAGKLIVTGGTIKAQTDTYEVKENSNGLTTYGAGISISQHTTKQPIDVKISGGTISGYYAFSEANPLNNPEEDINKISIEITGGVFSDNTDKSFTVLKTNQFISGGIYDHEVTEYVVDGYGEVDIENDKIEVTKIHNVEIAKDLTNFVSIPSDKNPYKKEVIITIPPEKLVGKTLEIIDEQGNIIPVVNNRFIMPDCDVSIRLVDKIENPKTNNNIGFIIVILLGTIVGYKVYKSQNNKKSNIE